MHMQTKASEGEIRAPSFFEAPTSSMTDKIRLFDASRKGAIGSDGEIGAAVKI